MIANTSTNAFNVDMNNLYNRIEWLKQNEDSRVLQLKTPLKNDGYILSNLDVSGFYRINYDPQSWDNIVKQLTVNKDVNYLDVLSSQDFYLLIFKGHTNENKGTVD